MRGILSFPIRDYSLQSMRRNNLKLELLKQLFSHRNEKKKKGKPNERVNKVQTEFNSSQRK